MEPQPVSLPASEKILGRKNKAEQEQGWKINGS